MTTIYRGDGKGGWADVREADVREAGLDVAAKRQPRPGGCDLL